MKPVSEADGAVPSAAGTSYWQQRFLRYYQAFKQNRGERELMTFSQLGQEMHQAGVPPEVAVEAYALARCDALGDGVTEDEAILPLMEVIMTYGLTYRQQIEWQKHTSNAQFFQVLEASNHLICITTPNQQVVYTNPAFNQMIGTWDNRSDVVLSALLGVEEEVVDALTLSIDSQGSWQGALNVTKPDDRVIRLRVNAFALGLSGRKHTHLVFMAEDISEKVVMQKRLSQAQKLTCLGELASGIAHEFNNVMLIIQGFAELIGQEADERSRTEFVAEILTAIDKGKALNEQIMGFASDRPVAVEPRQLATLVDNIRQFVTTAVGSRIELVFRLDDQMQVCLSEQHLCQILTNLCINARHAIELRRQREPHLKGRITIQCQQASPSPWMILSVKDNGCGMSNEVKRQLFEPFFTTKGVGEGNGLGLSILQKLVHQYRGEVQVSSEPNGGADFRLFLPVLTGKPSRNTAIAVPRQLLNHWLNAEHDPRSENNYE